MTVPESTHRSAMNRTTRTTREHAVTITLATTRRTRRPVARVAAAVSAGIAIASGLVLAATAADASTLNGTATSLRVTKGALADSLVDDILRLEEDE